MAYAGCGDGRCAGELRRALLSGGTENRGEDARGKSQQDHLMKFAGRFRYEMR